MGTFQQKAKKKTVASRLPSNSPNATVNRAGGVAFEIRNAALKLITMTGGSFFAEPKYYDTASVAVARRDFNKLVNRIDIVDGKLDGFASCSELDTVARELIATAIDVAESENPEDLLAIANWLRNSMNIRLTPQILLVIASRIPATQPFVRKYAPKIIVRPDEVKTIYSAHRFFFGLKTMANCLARGVTDALAKFGERGLMKYDGDDFPKWRDILQVMHKRKKDYPLPDAVAKYFLKGEVVDPVATPVIAARKALAGKKSFDAEAKDLAKRSFVNWEVLLSQFGSSQKTEVWEFLIDEKLLGYMAMIRNLRNILEAKVSGAHIAKVSHFISDRDEVLKSKQLPFRFLSAHKELGALTDVDFVSANELTAAVELASNIACEGIDLPGTTVIFADNSRSMSQPVSGKSKISCADAANILCGIVAKGAEKPYVLAFGTEPAQVRFTKNDTVIGIANKVATADTKGMSTNGHRCVQWMMKEGLTPDRVIFLSDMQMWDSSMGSGCVANEWAKYLKTAGAKNTWLHCIHLNGSGDAVVDEMKHVNQLAGFSEKVFTMLRQTEGISTKEEIPSVDQIRKDWTVK